MSKERTGHAVQTDRWRERVDALSTSQRQSLAEQLRALRGAPDSKRLTGFVVPSAGRIPSVESLRAFLAERLPDHMIPARVVTLERLPRTAAGKLDRSALATVPGAAPAPPHPATSREGPPDESPAVSETEAKLLAIWREVLKVDEIALDDDFFEIGGDSLLSIRVIAKAGRAGIRIPPQRFFEHPTVRHMAAAASPPPGANVDAAPAATRRLGAVDADRVGGAPLTPIQHWFLEAVPEHRDWWNQGYLLALDRPLEPAALREVTRSLVEQHEALRLRLVERDGAWEQHFPAAGDEVPFRAIDVSGVTGAERDARIAFEADREQASLRLTEGRLFRVVLFFAADGWQRLLLVSHHMVVDGVSWSIILEDLATLVTQAQGGTPLQLATTAGAASPRHYALALRDAAASNSVAAAASHWLSHPVDGGAMPLDDESLLPAGRVRDGRALVTTNADAEVVTLTLDADTSRRVLQDAPRRLDATAQSLLLAALALAWRGWTGHDVLWLDLEGHGRDVLPHEGDVSRTVGWFTTVFPIRLAPPAGSSAGADSDPAAVVQVVRRTIDELPMRGAAHGLLRHLAPDVAVRERLASLPRPTLLFNYLGTHDTSLPASSSLRVTDEYAGRTRSPLAVRPYLVEINASSQHGQLIVSIEYARHVHRRETIDRFASLLRDALQRIAVTAPPPTTVAGLDPHQLDTVAALLGAFDEPDDHLDEEVP